MAAVDVFINIKWIFFHILDCFHPIILWWNKKCFVRNKLLFLCSANREESKGNYYRVQKREWFEKKSYNRITKQSSQFLYGSMFSINYYNQIYVKCESICSLNFFYLLLLQPFAIICKTMPLLGFTIKFDMFQRLLSL